MRGDGKNPSEEIPSTKADPASKAKAPSPPPVKDAKTPAATTGTKEAKEKDTKAPAATTGVKDAPKDAAPSKEVTKTPQPTTTKK